MKGKWLAMVLAASVLVFSVSAAAPAPNEKSSDTLEKTTFIHYKDGKVKMEGKPAKAPACYKLLGVKWRALPASYVVNPGIYGKGFVTGAISASAAEWDSHTSAGLFGGYAVNYSASWDATPEEVDYQNEYVFGPYPEDNVIAVTNIWYTKVGKQIVDYDVLFNAYYDWKDCSISDCAAAMDLQNIATHETGHGIGLGDVYSQGCSEATMYGYSWEGDMQKRDLAAPDIAGLQRLYGA